MTELERFFRRLVANLAGSDPARLHRPIPLEDILESIVPYRSNRRALLLESSEDYELVVLRLCAGEGGLVRTEPEEVRARFAEEAASTNPDLHVLHKFEHVLVSIRSEPLARALDAEPEPALPYAPHFATQPLAGLDLPALDPLNDLDPNEPDASAAPDEAPRRPTRRTASTAATRSRATGRFGSVRTAGNGRRHPSVPGATAMSSPGGATA